MATASMVEFQKNRPHFSEEELEKYNGNWVAFSADGKRIVARGETLEDLFIHAELARIDMQDVVLDHILYEPFVISLGAQEFEYVYLNGNVDNGKEIVSQKPH